MIRMSKKLISLFLIFCMLLPILTTSITANAVSARKGIIQISVTQFIPPSLKSILITGRFRIGQEHLWAL